ncbi:hypothetical protein R80B4_01969 [Fibrobacteres bacterium R8-0-B4]
MITNKYKNIERNAVYTAVFIVSAFFLLPFILFGADSYVTPHDNLDSIIPWYKMYHDNGLFFLFDAPTKGHDGMSTLYYSQMGFYFQSFLFLIFSDFTAYVISYYFAVFIGFISMYILLKKMLGFSSTLSVLMAVCYAFLPVILIWNIAIATLPLIIAIFIHFASKHGERFSWKTLALLFFPFFSFFATVGIFILAIWFIATCAIGIKTRKINLNLLVGFFLLCIGYIVSDIRLFYVMFIDKVPLNRSTFAMHPVEFIAQIQTFFYQFVKYLVNGHFFAASLNNLIIMPTVFLVSLNYLIVTIVNIKKQNGTISARIKAALNENEPDVKRLFLFELIAIAICFVAALDDSGLFDKLISKLIPILKGFLWSRVWIFNRVLWYVVFAFCLKIILKNNIGGYIGKKIRLPQYFSRICVGVLVCLQLGYIMLIPVIYNDQVKTWFDQIVVKTGVAKKILPNIDYNKFVSYKEFFAAELFDRIKKDISYSGEKVAALGYHANILQYNGFNCIDGYNNLYPLSYKQRFRNLIAPELEINESEKDSYDNWAWYRMYLHNPDLNFDRTRDKNTTPVKLNIDMDVFKNDFKATYILSRAEISNSDTLGLDLVKRYYDDKSIYTIYLYKAI